MTLGSVIVAFLSETCDVRMKWIVAVAVDKKQCEQLTESFPNVNQRRELFNRSILEYHAACCTLHVAVKV